MSNQDPPIKERWHRLKFLCALIGFGAFGPLVLGQAIWMAINGEVYVRSRLLASVVERPILFYTYIAAYGAGALLLTAVSVFIVIAFIRGRRRS